MGQDKINDWVKIEYKKYLSDQEGNIKKLEELFTTNRGLLKAPTGSGKTRTFLEIANYMTKKLGKRLIFAVPKKKQAEQIEQEYRKLGIGVTCVTGDVKAITDDNLIIACVYDSIEKVFKLKDWAIDDRTIVIFDESHRGRYDAIFRSRAVKLMNNVISKTTCIYISATTKIIEDLEFDIKIECTPTQKNHNYDVCYYLNYGEEQTRKGILMGLIPTLIKENPATGKKLKVLLFLNDKKILNNLKEYFECVHDSKVAILTGDTKDKENKTMNQLVTTGELKGADIYLSTSVIEEGINIMNTEQFACIYAMDSLNPCYDSLEQACARLRTKGHIAIILRKENDQLPQLRKLLEDEEEIYNRELEKIDLLNNRYKQLIEDGLIEKGNKTFIDALTVGKYIILNDESNTWEISKDRFIRYKFLMQDKFIFNCKQAHKREIKKRVKAKKFLHMVWRSGLTKEQEQAYKEISKKNSEERKEEIKVLLEIIKSMSEEAFFTLEHVLLSNGTSLTVKGIPIKEEEKGYIELIRNHKEVSKLLRGLLTHKIDIKNMLITHDTDYRFLKKSLKKIKYAKWNSLINYEMIKDMDIEDEDALEYIKIRKYFDTKQGKELNSKDIFRSHKIKSPNSKETVKTLSDKQVEGAINLLNNVYHVGFKENSSQYRLGTLLKPKKVNK